MFEVRYYINEPDDLSIIHDNGDLFRITNGSFGETMLLQNIETSISAMYAEVKETSVILQDILKRVIISAKNEDMSDKEIIRTSEKLAIKCNTGNESSVFCKLLRHGFVKEHISRSRVNETSRIMFHRNSNTLYDDISILYETLSHDIYDVIFDSEASDYPV